MIFIDEAGQLAHPRVQGGLDIVQYLLTTAENHRDTLTFMLSGYPSQFKELMKMDAGTYLLTHLLTYSLTYASVVYVVSACKVLAFATTSLAISGTLSSSSTHSLTQPLALLHDKLYSKRILLMEIQSSDLYFYLQESHLAFLMS